MDGHIQEDTPGTLDVADGRRGRVPAGDAQDMLVADLPAGDYLTGRAEVGIEAAVKTDLQFDPGFFNLLEGLIDFSQVVIDWFLAENVFACRSGLDDQSGMRTGG